MEHIHKKKAENARAKQLRYELWFYAFDVFYINAFLTVTKLKQEGTE